MGRRVIFLDVDGVLLPFGDDAEQLPEDGSFPDQPLHALSHIVERTGAEIVLSSTWRMHPSAMNEITSAFFFFATRFGGPLGNITHFEHTTSLANHSVRQWEIAEWLDSPAAEGVSRWVALDDEELLAGSECAARRSRFEGHVVKTQSHIGLTPELAELAVSLINQDGDVGASGAKPTAVASEASRASHGARCHRHRSSPDDRTRLSKSATTKRARLCVRLLLRRPFRRNPLGVALARRISGRETERQQTRHDNGWR
jgi:hypothetical protein